LFYPCYYVVGYLLKYYDKKQQQIIDIFNDLHATTKITLNSPIKM